MRRRSLIGFAGSPFTVACYMVEGHGSRDFAAPRRMAYAEPAVFARLIRTLVEATADYLLAQAEAGAEALMLFDSWAGLLPPSQFRRWVIEPTAALVGCFGKRLPEIPIIGFPRLAGPMLAEYAQRTGVQASASTPPWIRAGRPRRCRNQALQGNLDPLALVAGGMALEAEARAILGAMRGRPFIFNLGHGIEKTTPPEHVAALVRLVRTG